MLRQVRRALALAVAAGLFLPPVPGATTGPARASTTVITVLTYNIHYEDPGRVADVVAGSGADVVALQEVDVHRKRSGCVDQAAEIAEELDMTAVFGANYDSGHECGDGRLAQHGDALLSRLPILEWNHTLLPSGGGEQRGVVEAVLDAGGGRRIRAASTHFEYRSASERKDQARAVSARLEGSDQPVVVMGDLNGEPSDPALGPVRDAFTDAWEEAGDGDGFTNPSRRPRRRIDYVFVGSGVVVHAAEVLDSRVSDHLPVVAELVL